MTWEIFVGLLTVAGGAVTLWTQASKLSRTLALLESAVKELKEVLGDVKRENREEHRAFCDRLDRCEERLRQLEAARRPGDRL